MPSRTPPLVTGETYHIYNRGSEKRRIFDSKKDYHRCLKTIKYYKIQGPKPKFSKFSSLHKIDPSKKIVEIISYELMPNHVHFQIRQLQDGGITEFVSKWSNSYTKYYNTKYNRVGPLFQGEFKSVLMESDEQLIHVSRYIHLNPLVSSLVANIDDYQWSSWFEYMTNTPDSFCETESVLEHFKDRDDYRQFVLDQAGYATELEFIKHQLLDE